MLTEYEFSWLITITTLSTEVTFPRGYTRVASVRGSRCRRSGRRRRRRRERA
jgi:hypothetical protein